MSWAFESFQRYAFAQIFCNGKRVIDAGCKLGYGTEYLAQVAGSVIGIDIDQERLNKIKKIENVELVCQDLEKALSVKPVHVVVCLETLEHLDEPKNFLMQLPKVLKRDGLLVFSVPFGDRLRTDGTRIDEHKQVFYTERDVTCLIEPFLDVDFIDRQLPMSFVGVARNRRIV